MSWLLSIDPGTKASGAAIWLNGDLYTATLVKGSEAKYPDRWIDMADALYYWWFNQHISDDTPEEVVIEFPKIYPAPRSKARPEDILNLAAGVGTIIGRFVGSKVSIYLPYEWKSNLPKEIMIERVKKRLSKDEATRIQLDDHNIYDGVGIGLKYLKRL